VTQAFTAEIAKNAEFFLVGVLAISAFFFFG